MLFRSERVVEVASQRESAQEELPPAHLKGKEKPFRMFDVKGLRPHAQVPAAVGH